MAAPEHFDLIIIGSGSGNSIVDERFADQKVAIIDQGINGHYGGTCLNVGCIPTKMYAYPADVADIALDSARLGVTLGPARVDFPAIRDRVFGRIDTISEAGREWRADAPDVTLFESHARFTGPREIGVAGRRITADRVVVAAGSRPHGLDVPGGNDPRIHTSDTIMRLETLPESMVILGGGFVAVEMAHVFAAYGTKVTLVNRSGILLRRDDEDIAQRFTELMGRRLPVRLDQELVRIESDDDDHAVVVVTRDAEGVEYEYGAEVVLNATGRVPNGDRLNLAAAGIETDDRGFIKVDPQQRTTAEGVFALGDVCSPWMLKHVANAEARTVQHNLLHPDAPVATNHDVIPYAVFSRPQVASVGATEQQLRADGTAYVRAIQDYGSVAYGWAMDDSDHFAKLLATPDGRLLGAHIIGPEAPILVQPLVQAMSFGLGVHEMARGQYWIHPALTELVENALLSLPLDGR